jgi:DNA-binding beta-propeller fold protein YncE
VYVVDAGNFRIQKFDGSGNFLLAWGSQGSGPGQFLDAAYIAVDSLGNVYVTDGRNSCVQKFDSSGNFITQWGSQGSGPGQFNMPRGVAVDSSGNVYVTEAINQRVQKFEPVVDPCASQEAALDNFSWGDFPNEQEAEKAYRELAAALIDCRRKYGLPPRG